MRAFISLLITLSLFAGCSNSLEPLPSPLKILNLNMPADPSSLDPRKGGDLVSSIFHFLLFDGLVRMDDDGNVAPSLAETIDLSEDRTVYTFTLKEADWSDGTPITAWDFEKSWKDILHPDYPAMNAHLFYCIKNAEKAKLGTISLTEVGIRSVDARTLEITLQRPTPYFLEIAAFCSFYPVNAEIDHTHPEWDQGGGKNFVCSGPFTLKEWKRNNKVVLVKNPWYHRADAVVLDEIHLGMVDSEMTSLQMFEKGQIDILGQPLIPIPADAISEVAKKQQLHIVPVPATTFCTFNVSDPYFSNVHIRKAFGYAINRREIVKNITQLNETPALGIIPPVLQKNRPIKAYYKDAEPELAKEHLKWGLEELGIDLQELPTISYLYSASESHHKIAQALQQQWSEALGVHVELESVDKKILIHQLKSRNYQIAQSFWMAQYNDPMNIFERFKHRDNVKNYPNWEDKTYIDLLDRSCLAKTDEERFALLDEAESLFLDQMPVAPIFHWNSAYIAKPHVKSFGVAPIGNGFFDRVYFEKDSHQTMR